MGACQSNRNSAVDAKRNRMDAANKKMDEGQFLYNDTANAKTDNKNNTNQDGGSASVAGNTTTSTGTTSRHDKVLEWKDTLRNDGDLAAAVVHIEVRISTFVRSFMIFNLAGVVSIVASNLFVWCCFIFPRFSYENDL